MKYSAKEVKTELKANGIDTKKISVRCDWSAIYVTLKDLTLSQKQVQQVVAKKFQNYEVDEANGEILAGGNTFVFTEYDYDVVEQEVQKKIAELKEEKTTFEQYIQELKDNKDYHHVFKETEEVVVIISLNTNAIIIQERGGKTTNYHLTLEGLANALVFQNYGKILR